MEFSKESMKKAMYLITFAVLLYVGMQNLDIVLEYIGAVWKLLFPFVLGGAIAFVLNVPMRFVENKLFGKALERGNKTAKKFARPVSLVIAILLVAAIILLVVLVVAPELATTFVGVGKQIEASIPKLQQWIDHTFSEDSPVVEWANSIDIQPQKMLDSVMNVLKSGVNNVLSSTISVTMGIVSTAMNVGIGFIFSCYILLQKEKLGMQAKKAIYALFPKRVVEYILHVCSLASQTFANFIAGQCIEAVILGSMFFVTMTIGRFPYALLVGVLISFTALIPVFGGFIGCGIGFFLILMVSPMKALMFLVLFLVLQQIEGNLIYPHVVGNSVGLPSIWVLVAVTLGGSLMGIVGMLVFIPLVSVLYALFREWTYKRLRQKKIQI
ncbi:MAG: AI-2E family transporter [Eubacteriales bacterium]|nr:AI-2E family transporter [Eubacteriales bacterium]